jgi:hypothetical protein
MSEHFSLVAFQEFVKVEPYHFPIGPFDCFREVPAGSITLLAILTKRVCGYHYFD